MVNYKSTSVAGDPKTVTHRVYRKIDYEETFATRETTKQYLADCGLWG